MQKYGQLLICSSKVSLTELMKTQNFDFFKQATTNGTDEKFKSTSNQSDDDAKVKNVMIHRI